MFKRKISNNRDSIDIPNQDSIDTNDSDNTVIRHRRSKSLWNKIFRRKNETEIEPERDLEVPWNYVKN